MSMHWRVRLMRTLWFLQKYKIHTSLGTQCLPGYSLLLSPFTRIWITILVIFPWIFNLESQNQAKNMPVVLPSSQIKLEANQSRSAWVMIRHTKNTQTKQDYYFIFFYLEVPDRTQNLDPRGQCSDPQSRNIKYIFPIWFF